MNGEVILNVGIGGTERTLGRVIAGISPRINGIATKQANLNKNYKCLI